VVSFVKPVLRCDQRWCNLQLGCVTSASRDGGLKTTHVGQGSSSSSSSSSSKLVRCCRQRSVSNQETGFQTGRDFRALCWCCCCCWKYRDWKSVKGDGIDIYWCRQTDKPNLLRLLPMTSTKCVLSYSQHYTYTVLWKWAQRQKLQHQNPLTSQHNVFPTHLITTARQTITTPQLRGSTQIDPAFFLRYDIPFVFKLHRMESISPIHNRYFAHHSYMLRLPQRSHHQAAHNIIKKEFTR